MANVDLLFDLILSDRPMVHHYKVGYSCSWKLSVFFAAKFMQLDGALMGQYGALTLWRFGSDPMSEACRDQLEVLVSVT